MYYINKVCGIFFAQKISRKNKRVQTECLQPVHLYSLSRDRWIALRCEAALGLPHNTAVFQGKIVFIVLTFIHISFLCWKQKEGKPDLRLSFFFFYSHRSIGLPFSLPGRINRQSKRVFFSVICVSIIEFIANSKSSIGSAFRVYGALHSAAKLQILFTSTMKVKHSISILWLKGSANDSKHLSTTDNDVMFE